MILLGTRDLGFREALFRAQRRSQADLLSLLDPSGGHQEIVRSGGFRSARAKLALALLHQYRSQINQVFDAQSNSIAMSSITF